jgi:hypothetical protein
MASREAVCCTVGEFTGSERGKLSVNTHEIRLLNLAAADDGGVVFVDKQRHNGKDHRAAAYLHAECYGIYYADAIPPHFQMYAETRKAWRQRLQTEGKK